MNAPADFPTVSCENWRRDQFNNNGKYAGTLLIDIDRRRKCGGPFAGMFDNVDHRHAGLVGSGARSDPRIGRVFDAAVLSRISLPSYSPGRPVWPRLVIEHLSGGIASHSPAKKDRRLPESDPRKWSAGPAIAREKFASRRSRYRGRWRTMCAPHKGGPRFGGNRLQLIADRRDDLVVMVSARVWLTCCAVRHHSKCTPTALTMMDVSTRPEIAPRIPTRIRAS
jgi:hypothetical protein